MPFNLLLLPLLGGFILISVCNRFKFQSVRLDGYRLLFHSSLAGVVLLIFAELLVLLFRENLSWVDRSFHQVVSYNGAGVATLAFLVSYPLSVIANLGFKVEKEIDRVIDRKGDPLELILRRSLKETKPVLLTVKNGKVYVGFVTYNSSPAVPVESMKILPVSSGYRNSETKTVEFTTDYSAVFKKKLEGDPAVTGTDFSDFEIVIPFREIESVGIFDSTIYKVFSGFRKDKENTTE
jgi:hypothetical protein